MAVLRTKHNVDGDRGELERFEVSRIARSIGCDVLETTTADAYGRTWVVLELDCHDNETAIRFLTAMAKHDAYRPEIRAIAGSLLHVHPNGDADFGSGVQEFVKRNVKYVVEADEEFQSALLTLEAGEGDCDKQARCVAAICIAGGILRAQCFGVSHNGEIVHVCSEIPDAHFPDGWAPLETTVDARYGEEPVAAKTRLDREAGK